MVEDVTSIKRKLALSYQILYLEEITKEDTLGHISARLPGGDTSYIKPWGMGFEEVTPDNLLTMDLEGNKVAEAEGRLHSELPIHNEIYKARPDVNSIVHIHPFYATLLSSVWQGKLLLVNQNTQVFAGGIGYYKSSELIRSKDQGKELAATLGNLNVVLLRNHGVVVAGATVEQALLLTVQLEKAAHTHMALAPFSDVTEIPSEIALHWCKELLNIGHTSNKFNYWCRKLKREGKGVYNG